MGNDKFENAKEMAKTVATQTVDGFNHVQNKMASLSKEQVENVRNCREAYYKNLEIDEDVALAKMNEYAMDIYKSYLSEMSTRYLPVCSGFTSDVDSRIRYFNITKWVVDSEEKDIDKLINVYQVLSQQECNIALIYNRNANECRVILAVANIGKDSSPDIANQFAERIQKSIKGNFPGAKVSDVAEGSPLKTYKEVNGDKFYYSVASISNLASDKSENFISQSMEKLLDGIVPEEGKEYSLILLATPCNGVEKTKTDMMERYSALSVFSQWQTNLVINEGKMLSAGSNVGANVGVNFVVSGGINAGRVVNNMEQSGKSEGVTRTYINYGVKHLLDTIEKQVKRLEESDALGMWNFAAYAISDDPEIAEDVAHMYLSLTQGNESYVSKAAINLWEGGFAQEEASEAEKPVVTILSEVCALRHPLFVAYSVDKNDFIYPFEKDLTTVLSGRDLAKALNFPHRSVAGLPVVEGVSFGREVYKNDGLSKDGESISVGTIYHMHSPESKPIILDINSLCSHTFVTGSTGKGKSNTVYKLLEQVSRAKSGEEFSFLVVEPAKGEYKDAFWKHPTINTRVLGTNPKESELLRLNPFSFPTGIHVLEHIDRLTEIFNACWPMYAAMPAILKNAIIRAYESCGWDMTNSENCMDMYPGFGDVLEQINNILNSSAFSDDNKGDYTGALCTRVESLTTGLNGMIFSGYEVISDEELFTKNVIVDLSRVGAPDTKSLIMSILVMKLQEYRMCEKKGANLPLRHLTVLEEAHNILKRTSTEQSADTSNVQGKAVEVISNAIAEMRTYGEGFIIADQAPGLMDISVIRNTNTKIIMCLPEEEDRQIAGRSIGLNDKQIMELSKLERGIAAVYQNDWQEAVLCQFEKYHKDYSPDETEKGYPLDKEMFSYTASEKLKSISQAKVELLKYMLSKVLHTKEPYSEEMKGELLKNVELCGFKAKAHRELDQIIRGDCPDSIDAIAPYVAYLYNSEALLDNITAQNIDTWNEQVLHKLDATLINIEESYQQGLIRCLMHEQSRINIDFAPYEQKWVEYMRGRM